MSSTTDLMGVGCPAAQALALGLSSVAITAAGTTITGATQCDNQNKFFIMTATGADGIVLNAAVPLLTPVYVVNISGSIGKVYPVNSSGTFNGLSAGTAISVGANKSSFFIRYSANGWMSNLSA
jgi:hypothetical protein